MRKLRGSLRPMLAALCAAGAAAPVAALELLPPEGGDLTASEPIALGPAVPGAPPPTVLVDGVDVSGFLRRGDDRWLVVLPMPLELGGHRIDVREADPASPWATFQVRVVPEKRTVEGSIAGAFGGDLSHRFADQHLVIPTEVDRGEGGGAPRLSAELRAGPLELSAYAPILYDSHQGGGPARSRWDFADYLGTAKLGPLTASAGQHAPVPSTLLLQGFNRRGLSVRLDGPLRTFASGFMFRTEPITGFRERFGVGEPEMRLRGVTAGSEGIPLPAGLGELLLSGTWLRATGGERGSGVGAGPSQQITERGSAWGAAFDLTLAGGRARVVGEWAHTRFDFDGGGGTSPEKDAAWLLYGEVTPLRAREVLGRPLDVVLSYELREVEPFFRSLGNAGAAVDLFTRMATLRGSWGGFVLDASQIRLRDNRDDRSDQVTYRDDTWKVATSWSPLRWEMAGWRRFVGRPTIQASWSRHRTKPLANVIEEIVIVDPMTMDVIVQPAPAPFNETTRTAALSIGSSYERASWTASHTRRRFDDATGTDPDTFTKATAAQVSFQPHPRVGLTTQFQRDVSRPRDPASKTTTKLVGSAITLDIVPEIVDASFKVDWQQTQNDERTSDRSSFTWTLYTSWRVLPPEDVRPGLRLTLLGTYQDVNDAANPASSLDGFQTFLRLEIDWRASHAF